RTGLEDDLQDGQPRSRDDGGWEGDQLDGVTRAVLGRGHVDELLGLLRGDRPQRVLEGGSRTGTTGARGLERERAVVLAPGRGVAVVGVGALPGAVTHGADELVRPRARRCGPAQRVDERGPGLPRGGGHGDMMPRPGWAGLPDVP